jgi:hypothetical protein
MNKSPDLVDFCVTKGIPQDFANVQSCFDLSSAQSPILITLSTPALRREPPPSLCNRSTNFDEFRNLITERLALHIPLKQPKTLKQQSNTSMTQSNGLAGTQRLKKQAHSRPMNAFTDKTKNLGQTQTMQTLAPTPYIKEETPAQHSNPRTQTTSQQQQKSQHPNLPPRPHAYGIHLLFPMKGDQKNKTDHEIISPTTDGSRNMGAV